LNTCHVDGGIICSHNPRRLSAFLFDSARSRAALLCLLIELSFCIFIGIYRYKFFCVFAGFMNFCLCTPHKYGCSMLLCLFFLHIVHMLYFKVEIHVSMEKLCYSSFMNGEVVAGCSFYVQYLLM